MNDIDQAGGAAGGKSPWDFEALSKVPRVFEAPGFAVDGVKALFFEGAPFQGKPTRVFAYYAVPEAAGPVPAMVLVHGGGGSAFASWVKMWAGRGYAAIAMDTCGCTSGGLDGPHAPHEHGGPRGWGGFDQVDQPLEDQWPCQATAAVVLAHSLIRSFPGVDPERTGLTGISWGGYLTCLAAALDPRFNFAAPVYGCGFLGDNSGWLETFEKMGPEKARRWLSLWDPSVYLPRVQAPMLWVTGTNDFAYPLDSLRKSVQLLKGPSTLSVRVRMPHGHLPGMEAKEIPALAEARFGKGAPLARITGQGCAGRTAWVQFETTIPLARAELNFTADDGPWEKRNWQSLPATLHAADGGAMATLPDGARFFFFNLMDERDLVVSSGMEDAAAD
jgi:cephalosporin-C deacetylase-like acetyl esterase